MPGSFCIVCRVRIPRGAYCKAHRPRSPSDRAWRRPGAWKLRAQILARDRYACTVCGSTKNVEVHHPVPISEGGSHDPANLIVLCAEHHREAHRKPPLPPAD